MVKLIQVTLDDGSWFVIAANRRDEAIKTLFYVHFHAMGWSAFRKEFIPQAATLRDDGELTIGSKTKTSSRAVRTRSEP